MDTTKENPITILSEVTNNIDQLIVDKTINSTGDAIVPHVENDERQVFDNISVLLDYIDEKNKEKTMTFDETISVMENNDINFTLNDTNNGNQMHWPMIYEEDTMSDLLRTTGWYTTFKLSLMNCKCCHDLLEECDNNITLNLRNKIWIKQENCLSCLCHRCNFHDNEAEYFDIPLVTFLEEHERDLFYNDTFLDADDAYINYYTFPECAFCDEIECSCEYTSHQKTRKLVRWKKRQGGTITLSPLNVEPLMFLQFIYETLSKDCNNCKFNMMNCSCIPIDERFPLIDDCNIVIPIPQIYGMAALALANDSESSYFIERKEFLSSLIVHHSKFFEKQRGKVVAQSFLGLNKDTREFLETNFPMSNERTEWLETVKKTNKVIAGSTNDMNANMLNFITTMERVIPSQRERTAFLEVMKEFNSNCGDAINAYDPKKNINTFFSHINKSASSFKNVVIKYALLTVILATAVHSTHDLEYLPILALAGCVFIYMYGNDIFESTIGKLIELCFKKLDNNNSEVTAQSGDAIYTLCASLVSGIGSIGSRKAPLVELYDKLSNMGRVKQSLTDICTSVMKMLEWFINIIRENVLDLPSYRLIKTNSFILDQFVERLDIVFDKIRKNEYTMNEDNFRELKGLEMEGKRLVTQIPNTHNTRNIISYFEKEMDKLRSIIKKWSESNMNMKGARIETTIVLLRGGPGCGKSITLEHLGFALVAQNIEDDKFEQFERDPYSFMFNRQFENKFWDGYTPDAVVCFIDDFGQSKDVEGVPDNEFMNVIRIGNGFETRLHMSDIKDKANTFFKSSFLIMSSNMRKIKTNSLYDDDALRRRFTIDVLVTVKKEYCTEDTVNCDLWKRKVDPSKLPKVEFQDDFISDMSYEIQEFYNCDSEGLPVGEPFSFEELVVRTQQAHNNRKKWHSNHKYNFSKTLNKYRTLGKSGDIVPQSSVAGSEYFNCEDYSNEDYLPAFKRWRTVKNTYSQNMDMIIEDSEYTKAVRWFKDYGLLFKIALGVIIGGVALKALFELAKWLYTLCFGKDLCQSFSWGSKPMKIKTDKKNAKNLIGKIAKAQNFDPSGKQIMKQVLTKSIWKMEVEHPETREMTLLGHALGLYDHYILCPFHYVKALLGHIHCDANFVEHKMRFSFNDKCENLVTVREFLSNINFDYLAELDSAVYKSPKDFPCSTNIMKSLATEEDHKLLDNNISFTLPTPSETFGGSATVRTSDLKIESADFEAYTVNKTYQYKANTIHGDCGIPFFILNPRIPNRKVFGMHIAHNNKTGDSFSTCVYRELIEKTILEFENEISILEDLIPTDFYDSEGTQPQNGMLYAGNMHKSPSRGNNIKIVPSKLSGVFKKPLTAVSQLQVKKINGTDVDPFHKAHMKYCLPRTYINRNLFDNIANDLYEDMMSNAIVKVTPRLYTLHEALHGIETSQYFKGIANDTSAGYPMNISGNRNLKKLYVNDNDKYISEVNSNIQRFISDMNDGKRLLWLYTDALKVERRPIEKVLSCSTRMFSGVPWFLLILFRMYFGSFMMWIYENAQTFGISACLNVYSIDWEIMVRDLAQYDGFHNLENIYAGAGDYASYDGSEHAVLLVAVYIVIAQFYGIDKPEDNKIRWILWQEIINSVHIHEGKIYIWSGSLTSGNPLTFIINSILNILAFRYSWIRLIGNTDYKKRLCLKVGGDDNLFTVGKEYRDEFNELTLPPVMKEIGLNYTTEIKSDAIIPFRKLTEVEFLKRTFRRCIIDGSIVAPLRLEVVLEIPLWTKKTDRDNVAAGNVIESLRELSLWYDNELVDNENISNHYYNLIKLFEDVYPGVKTPTPLHMSIRRRKDVVKGLNYILPFM